MQIQEAKEEQLYAIARLAVQTQEAQVKAYPVRYQVISFSDALTRYAPNSAGTEFWSLRTSVQCLAI